MPHAPLLLPEVAGAAPEIARSVRSIDLTGCDAVVVASPHGRATGVYSRAAGDLRGFGPRGVEVEVPTDDAFARDLARRWGQPLLDVSADHGVVVPLRLLDTRGVPVVAVALAEGAAPGGLASALTAASDGRRVGFVASANTSAGLTERAPLTALPGAAEADGAVLDALRGRPVRLVEHLDALSRAGSCGAAPLTAFAELFPETPCTVLAYEHPYGVGYAVAVTS